MRKPTIKSLQRKLKKEVDIVVKMRDNSTCQWCGKYVEGSNCQVSHVIPKSRSKALRWNLLNLKVLCHNCHIEKWHRWGKGRTWFDKKFPERAKYLDKHERDTVKWKISDYEEMLKEYE